MKIRLEVTQAIALIIAAMFIVLIALALAISSVAPHRGF
jgi:hypothetical protein